MVFADPDNKAARELQADAFEQLGYQTENPTWRNEYLLGAYELRNGIPNQAPVSTSSTDMVAAMSPGLLLDYMGVRLNGPKAANKHLTFNWKQPDGSTYAIEMRNGVLIYTEGKTLDKVDATRTVDKLGFSGLMMGVATLDQEIAAGKLKVEGSKEKFSELVGLMDSFPVSIGEEWNLINRLPITCISAPVNRKAGNLVGQSPYDILVDPALPEVIHDPFDRSSGIGDMAYVGLLSPKEPIKLQNGKLVWGIGPTATFPTAEEDVLGSGKYTLGPAFVAAYLGQDWTLALFPQHWWSIGGDSARKDVSLTNVQYVIQRNIPGDAGWHVGMSPDVTVNWEASRGNKVTFPIGLGASRIFKFGSMPVRIGAEVQYAALHPDDQIGSRWNFRFIVPVIPTFLL
ncbi:hypothetical protein D3C80_305590 [compost metagenome]